MRARELKYHFFSYIIDIKEDRFLRDYMKNSFPLQVCLCANDSIEKKQKEIVDMNYYYNGLCHYFFVFCYSHHIVGPTNKKYNLLFFSS
jgi:hypothetical protein